MKPSSPYLSIFYLGLSVEYDVRRAGIGETMWVTFRGAITFLRMYGFKWTRLDWILLKQVLYTCSASSIKQQ